MEKTFVMIKPDVTLRKTRGIIGDIINRIEKTGLKIKALKMKKLTKEEAEEFYSPHKGKHFYETLIEFVTSGPVIGMIVEGEDAIKKIREICGATDPKKASEGTIRHDYGINITCNSIHASTSEEDFQRESSIFFSQDEVYDYEYVDEKEFEKYL
ncbi:MAG: nucleoside-diphosphate kinase [Candidatus Aenigmarchaeota archaeon]|nr:nucleoside-diphosphate kinase [Candidatus Aenigmarchaeota archaeon]